MALRLAFSRGLLYKRWCLASRVGPRLYANVPYSNQNGEQARSPCMQVTVCGASPPVVVTVRHGFPVLSLPLPSRNETCDFVLRPYLQTVSDITSSIQTEDRGIER